MQNWNNKMTWLLYDVIILQKYTRHINISCLTCTIKSVLFFIWMMMRIVFQHKKCQLLNNMHGVAASESIWIENHFRPDILFATIHLFAAWNSMKSSCEGAEMKPVGHQIELISFNTIPILWKSSNRHFLQASPKCESASDVCLLWFT